MRAIDRYLRTGGNSEVAPRPPRPFRRAAMVIVLSCAGISLALSALMPVWLDAVIDNVTGQLDCSALIPKLQIAVGRFEPAAVCAANTRLWVALFSVLAIQIAGIVAVLALNAGRLALSAFSELSRRQRAAAFGGAAFTMWALFFYALNGTGSRREAGLAQYQDVLVYADDQVLRLGLLAGFFITLNVLFLAACVIRRSDLEL